MMKEAIRMIAVSWLVICCLGSIPASTAAGESDSPPGPPPRFKPQPLTAGQKAKVKSILSRYNPSSLTAKDAKTIFAEFRKARIPGGPDMINAIRAAGFDPETLRSLAPPPGSPPHSNDRIPPGRPPELPPDNP